MAWKIPGLLFCVSCQAYGKFRMASTAQGQPIRPPGEGTETIHLSSPTIQKYPQAEITLPQHSSTGTVAEQARMRTGI